MKYIIKIKTIDGRMGYYERYDGKTIHLTDVLKWSIKYRTKESVAEALYFIRSLNSTSFAIVEEYKGEG